jgi:hypothetical protein
MESGNGTWARASELGGAAWLEVIEGTRLQQPLLHAAAHGVKQVKVTVKIAVDHWLFGTATHHHAGELQRVTHEEVIMLWPVE